MIADPAVDGHADGRDFFLVHPNAWKAPSPPADDPEAIQQRDDGRFQPTDVAMHGLSGSDQREHWIADQLAGSMPGNVAAAACVVELHAGGIESLGFGQHVGAICPATQGDHRRIVFDQDQMSGRGRIVLQAADELPL